MSDTVKSFNVFTVRLGAPSEHRPRPTTLTELVHKDKDMMHNIVTAKRLRNMRESKENQKIIIDCENQTMRLLRSKIKGLKKSALFDWNGIDRDTVERIIAHFA